MKKHIIILTLAFMAITVGMASAEMPHDGHSGHTMQKEQANQGHGNHAMHAEHGKKHGDQADNTIRQTMVDGHHFTYQLIDMRPKMANMKNMTPEMKQQMKSHHLMVYIKDSSGNSLANAKTGYLVEGPDGAKQKTMTMAMGGGFGADIDLAKKGPYNIKTKVAAGENKLSDSFQYEVQ